jgi:CRISPR-associated protein Cas1
MTTIAPPHLIPVRALNKVSYWPRLYYLEYVDSVMPINEFVEDGLFQHRRVNDPGLASRTRNGPRTTDKFERIVVFIC